MEHSAKTQLTALADQCVKCGLCLPHCPTYGLNANEADSPRGRIALIQGWTQGQLNLEGPLSNHLDGCLGCLNCERVCPSLVRVGELIDAQRACASKQSPARRRVLKRLLLTAMSNQRALRLVDGATGAYRAMGLPRLLAPLARKSGARLQLLNRLAATWGGAGRDAKPHRRPGATEVLLLPGCLTKRLQPKLPAAASDVLAHFGFDVSVASNSACCGAILRHNGFPVDAERRRRGTAGANPRRTLVSLASACAAELKSAADGTAAAEICRLLADQPLPTGVALSPLDAEVLVHVPCSQRNHLRDPDAAGDLLARIPGIRLRPLSTEASCCGAAGTYFLQHPQTSQALIEDLLSEQLPRSEQKQSLPRYLVTTNIGCALQLRLALEERGLAIEVLHPVELLHRQLESSAAAPDPG